MKVMAVKDILKLKGLDPWQVLCLKTANPATQVEVTRNPDGTIELGMEVGK